MNKELDSHQNRWLKIIATACFTMLAAALFVAHQSPVAGYELSIYAHTPTLVWAFLIISFVGGVTIIIHQVATKGYKNSHLWLIGFLILILAHISLLCLPFIRGYFIWGGDNITHLGLVKDVLSTGHFSSDNAYPITHILLSVVICLTGVSEIVVMHLSTTFISIMFALSIYLLATIVLPQRGQQLLATALTIPIFFTVNVTPMGWSMVLFPLLFFLYFKRSTPAYNILFLILLVLYPLFHPISSFMVIVALIILELSKVIFAFVTRHRQSVAPMPPSPISLGPAFIELAIFLSWILSFQKFELNVRVFWQQIVAGTQATIISEMGTTLAKINVQGFDFVVLLFKLYGVQIIFIILSLIAAFVLIKQIRFNNITPETRRIFGLLSIFLFAGLIYLFYLLGAPGMSAIGGDRIIRYTMLFTPIFAGFTLCELLKNVHFRHLASGGIVCVIMLASILSIFSLYPSPYVLYPSPQKTRMEMTGMTWFIEEKDSTVGCVYIMSPPRRFADGILGTIEANKRADLRRATRFPDHFGYTKHNTLEEQYTEDKYTAITKFDRIIYTTVWEEVGRFNDSDFKRLERDPAVDKLYSNGEMDIYLISGTGSP